ncbi:hypothetical protein AN958_06897 [Leucoagaricus sp. SymC.cos]|nr:hypothetical protein AN958_06897 [Leucoagaricus sp. SymC.cos]
MKALRHGVGRFSRKAVDRLSTGIPNNVLQTKPPPSNSSEQYQVPDDVIYELAHYLDTHHLYNLLLLDKSIYELVLPLLWLDIDTRESVNPEKKIGDLNKALQLKPERALLIKRWVVGMEVAMTENLKLSASTVNTIIELSCKGNLVNLTKFWWFCKKAPVDELWASLHSNCPMLKDIGMRRGPDDLIIEPNSCLLKFRDLTGFHLTSHGVYRHHHPNQIDAAVNATSIPPALYEMLVKHSPQLRELTLDGSCPERSIWDVWPILEGTWPELQSLSLGMVNCFNKSRPAAKEESIIREFMDRHPTLREVRFCGSAHWINSETTYAIPSHNNLTFFWGRNAQLKRAERLPCLRSVYLTDLFVDSANFSGILKRFDAITTLGLIIDEQQGKVKTLCQSIFDACPSLVHLDLRFRVGLAYYVGAGLISVCGPIIYRYLWTRRLRLLKHRDRPLISVL